MAKDNTEKSEFDRILEMREKNFADSMKTTKRKRKSFKKNRISLGTYPWEKLTAEEEYIYARIHHCKTQPTVVPTVSEPLKRILPFYPAPRRRFCLVYDHMNVPLHTNEDNDDNKLRLLNILRCGNGEGRIGDRKQIIDWSLYNARASPAESITSTPVAKRARRESSGMNNQVIKPQTEVKVRESLCIKLKIQPLIKEEDIKKEEPYRTTPPPLTENNQKLKHNHNTRSKKRYYLKLFEGTREVPPMDSGPSTKENSVASDSQKSESVTEEMMEKEEELVVPKEEALEVDTSQANESMDTTILSDSDPMMQSFLDAAIRDLDLDRIMPLEVDIPVDAKPFDFDNVFTPQKHKSRQNIDLESSEQKCFEEELESPGTRRGRPRKYKPGEEPVKLGVSTGRPRGRPRKYEHGYEEEYRRRASRVDDGLDEPSTSYSSYSNCEVNDNTRTTFSRNTSLNGFSKPKKSKKSQMPPSIANFGITDNDEYPTPPCANTSKETQLMCKDFEALYERVPNHHREAFHNEHDNLTGNNIETSTLDTGRIRTFASSSKQPICDEIGDNKLLSYARNIMPNFADERESDESEVEESDCEKKIEDVLSEIRYSEKALTEDSSLSSVSSISTTSVKEEAEETVDNEVENDDESISGDSHISVFTSGNSDSEREQASNGIEDDEDYFFDEEPLFEKFKRKHGYSSEPGTSYVSSPTQNSEGAEEINVEDLEEDEDEYVSPYKSMKKRKETVSPRESPSNDGQLEHAVSITNSKRNLFPSESYNDDSLPTNFCSEMNPSINQRITVKADSL